jgi:hypothetical protein
MGILWHKDRMCIFRMVKAHNAYYLVWAGCGRACELELKGGP